MKKILVSLIAVLTMVFTGCVTTEVSVDSVKTTSQLIGVATGKVVSLTNVDSTVKTNIVVVMSRLSTVVPTTNETFETVWTPVIKEELDKASSSMNQTQLAVANTVCNASLKGIDYVFSKHPEWRNNVDILNAAVLGFTKGYASVFGTTDGFKAAFDQDYDHEAYDYLKTVIK